MALLKTALIVAGPTCSGKSALSLSLAQAFGGVVINADSMQVYRDLRILSARPGPEEEEAAPHCLYGVLDASVPGSVAWWREQALDALERCWREGRLPILCGGTGMYLRALTEGLVEVPDPGEEARQSARRLLAEIGPEALHERLTAEDPQTAAALRPTDRQRIARAWEVWSGTGHGLSWWRERPALPAAACRFLALRLDPPRDVLRAAISRRFDAMLAEGALEEVRLLAERGLSPSLPALRAHGVPELMSVLRGEVTLDDARAAAVLAIGRYTRRQATWFRHHSLSAKEDSVILFQRYGVDGKLYEKEYEIVQNFISERIDASKKPS